MNKKINLYGTSLNLTNPTAFLDDIQNLVTKEKSSYVCFANVHSIVTTKHDKLFRDVISQSDISAPDGMPVVWASRVKGHKDMQKCSGPDMMEELFKLSEEKGYKNFFYGTTDETLQILKEKLNTTYPNLQIVGMISPPFRPLTEEEDKDYTRQINESGADFIWVGLGAPRQEIWMREHTSKINRGVMFGVGAAFNFHAGTVQRSPKWMQEWGLEWFFRFLKEPRRLWKRYATTNSLFIWYFLTDLFTFRTPEKKGM